MIVIGGLPVIYRACDCRIWPVTVAAPIGRCRDCGVRPHTDHPDPEDM